MLEDLHVDRQNESGKKITSKCPLKFYRTAYLIIRELLNLLRRSISLALVHITGTDLRFFLMLITLLFYPCERDCIVPSSPQNENFLKCFDKIAALRSPLSSHS